MLRDRQTVLDPRKSPAHDHGWADIGPVRVWNATFAEVSEFLVQRLQSGQKTSVAFCNAHTAYIAFSNQEYADILKGMILLNDGVGMDLACRLVCGRRFPENLNGTDFVPRMLERYPAGLRIFLLGARDKVVAETARKWQRAYKQHSIVGHRDGYFSQSEEQDIVKVINESDIDVLLVAMGNPHQEEFMSRNSRELNCGLVFGVGALFDFVSGSVARAPQWVRSMRLEWLYRLAHEPRRLGWRYTGELALFLVWVMRLRLKSMQRAKSR